VCQHHIIEVTEYCCFQYVVVDWFWYSLNIFSKSTKQHAIEKILVSAAIGRSFLDLVVFVFNFFLFLTRPILLITWCGPPHPL